MLIKVFKFTGMYTPGMMTDVVREVKEAARVREDALLSRVRALVEERSWTMNDTQMKLIRNMEEMKVRTPHLRYHSFRSFRIQSIPFLFADPNESIESGKI